MEYVLGIMTIIPIICMGYSIKKLFPPQPKRWKRLMMYPILYFAFTLPSWVGDENTILGFPFFMLGFLLLISGDKLSQLVIAGIFYSIFFSINMMIDTLFLDELMTSVMLVTKMLFWCCFAWFICHIVPNDGLKLSRRLWLLVGGLTLAPLVTMLSFSIWRNPFYKVEEYKLYYSLLKRLCFTSLPFVLVSAFSLLVAIVILSRHESLEQESKLTALREVYYTGLKQEQTTLHALRHDLRNHITAMQGLLEQDKYEEVNQYLQELTDSHAFSSGQRYSENEIANVVLSSKVAQMKAMGLTPNFEVSLPITLSISNPELCALLGNALDNAIEGTVGAKNKTIILRTRVEKGVFMLQVQNEVGRTVNIDFSTTKSNAFRHGYGLASMREIARKHNGSLKATVSDGRFELLVCFPCKE